MVTRESPWNDEARARAIALTEYEDSLCRCGCGLPREIAHDKARAKRAGFVVHEVICYAQQATEHLRAQHQKQHKDDPAFFYGRQYVAVPAEEKADDN